MGGAIVTKFIEIQEPELKPIWINADLAHNGLGSASCGPGVLPQYRLPAGEFKFAYRLTLHPGTP
jgi:hypothetical protein